MAHALLIPPATFVEHATRLRSRKLEQVAARVEEELRIRLVSQQETQKAPRSLASVIRQLRARHI